jgi:hypothetical protein
MRYSNPQELRAYAARDQAYMDQSGCGSHSIGVIGISGPQARMSCAEVRINNAMRLCVADRLEGRRPAPIPLPRLPVVPAPAQAPAPATASCQGGLTQNEKDFEAINARRPADASLIQSMQVGLYMTSKMMAHLQSACSGLPQASQYGDYKRAYDQTMTACRASVSSADVCVPKVAW